MAKFDSGVFSKASGKLTGLVFGRARTRTGKVMTARELVIPTNPQTPAQVAQRDIFREVLDLVQFMGPGIYRSDWDRSVEKLPGYQSLFSRLMIAGSFNSGSDFVEFKNTPNPTELGDLHVPDTISFLNELDAENIKIDWSTELGANGQNDDVPVIFIVTREPYTTSPDMYIRQIHVGVDQTGSITRATGEAIVGDPEADDIGFLGFLYFRPFDDSLTTQPSIATWGQANVTN